MFNIEDDLVEEIEEWMESTYLRAREVYTLDGIVSVGPMGINRIVSDICDEAYYMAPVINHEMINRHELSGQTLKARNSIIESMLENRDFTPYLKATSAEATIYRATILQSENEDIKRVRDVISEFLAECTDKKTSFGDLIRVLTRAPFGMRMGVIPLFLMDIMLRMDDLPVLYMNDKEVPIEISSINAISKHPDESYLLIEKATAEKTQFIADLANVFNEYQVYCGGVDPRNKLARITCLIQSWYRSLPQTSVVFSRPDYPEQNMDIIYNFRKLFSDYSINPREVLLDKLPIVLGTDILGASQKVAQLRKEIDEHIHLKKKETEQILRTTLRLSTDKDLCESLKTWRDNLNENVFRSVLSYHTENILDYISKLNTHDEESIVGHIAYEITGSYIEDWKDGTEEELQSGIQAFLKELDDASTNQSDRKVTYVSDDGVSEEKYYRYNANSISPSGQFFKNALDEVMDEYGPMVDKKERLGILMSIVDELLK